MSKQFFLIVSIPRNTFVLPEIQTADIGSFPRFSCSTGIDSGRYIVIWIKGENVSLSLDLPINVTNAVNKLLENVVGTSETLQVNATSGLAGGTYTCLTINEAGFDTANATLNLFPVATVEQNFYFDNDGDSITFNCLGNAYPPPTYSWQKYDTQSKLFTSLNQYSAQFTLDFVKNEDYGLYRCVVSSTDGEVAFSEAIILIGMNEDYCIPCMTAKLCEFIFYRHSCS